MTKAIALNIVLGLIITTCGCSEGEPEGEPSKDTGKFLILVVGSGIPDIDTNHDSPPLAALNIAQSKALYRGVVTAFKRSDRLKGLKSIVKIQSKDDKGDANQSSQLAKEIRDNRQVLAVIGHATSGTTLSAAWRYSQAGIPLIMPIATSPIVMYKPDKPHSEAHRLRNAFRLPPSDDRGQVPAIVHLISKLGLEEVYLLHEVTNGAEEYSGPLREGLESYMINRFMNQCAGVGRDDTNFMNIARSVRAQKSDGVVFCGYGRTALELLYALDQVYKQVSYEERPIIILSDGCFIPELEAKGFNIYLTFPHLETPEEVDKRELEILETISNGTRRNSYEALAYDAMLILGEAIQNCLDNGEVNRKLLVDQLNREVFTGIYGVYEFEEGENRLAQYDILHVTEPGQRGPLKLELDEVLTASQLQAIRARQQ